jgi:replication factor C large subunit
MTKETNKNLPWCEKHRASCFADVKGQDFAIEKVKLFLKSFPRKKALVLHGPPGTGKTSLAYALASELDLEILELNASDLRDKEKINQIIGPAAFSQSLFKKGKVILIDEVDGISSKDRGGLSELLGILEKTVFPLIITANDIWQQKFNLLRQKSEMVALKEIDYKIILDLLRGVCFKESCRVNDEVLTSISIRARGDIRAAINDLEIVAHSNETLIVKDLGERNKEQSIFTALQYIFKNSKLDTKMVDIFDEVHMELDEIFLWVEENIPLEYKGVELAKALDALSRADVFRGRIYRQQYWRFMVYEYFYLGAGIASAKKGIKTGWTNYRKPTRVLKIWLQNQRNAMKKTICQKYAKYCHISTKQAMKDFLLIRQILINKKVRSDLKLSDDEVMYLDKPIM